MFLATVNMPGWGNPYHPRMFGGTLVVVVIFALLVLLNKDWDWEKIKFAYVLMYLWVPINIIMEGSLLAIYGPILSTAAITQNIMDIVIMSVLGVLGVYSYIKQRG